MCDRFLILCALALIFLGGCDDGSATQAIRERSTTAKPHNPKVAAKEDKDDSETQDTANLSRAAKDIEQLIDELVNVSEPGFGYAGYFSGSEFLPYEDTEEMATLVFGGTRRARSDTLREIVEKGAVAVPLLLKHLDDDRKIKMKPLSGMMWMDFADEYDFNRRTRKEVPQGVNKDTFGDQKVYPDHHAVTIGDLCFVALGQIVNRRYSATRYQPTAGLVVSSPTYSETLRKAVLADWSGLTEELHKRSLIADFTTPDHDGRRIGAYLRLSLYYPETVEQLVLDQLCKPTFDVYAIEDFCRNMLYKTQDKNERQRKYDAFIRERGDAYSVGIMYQLFDDLDMLEASEEGRISPPLTEYGAQPRELLIQLFGKPANVKSSDRPVVEASSESERARLIGALTHDTSRKIGDVVRQIFLDNPEDDYMASACLSCLANRGYGDFLVEQLERIDPAETNTNYLHLEYLESISTSKEKVVQDRLLEIIRSTKNEQYFMAALAGLAESDDAMVLGLAEKILDGLPDETERGREMLEMIGERFPDKAKDIYEDFLSKGSARRAETMCVVLWYGGPLSAEVLAPLLDDKRKLDGFSIPMRVCDLAAQAISHTTDELRFDSDWSLPRKDATILKLKRYCAESIK